MVPSVQQAKVTAMRDNEIVALVFFPSGEVRCFSEPVEMPSPCSPEDAFSVAAVGLTAQINLSLLKVGV